jgi:hypothetical protein
MLEANYQQSLRDLEALDFRGKGEAYVEQKFLTPLLQLLGYEAHRDYEVLRHGDAGSTFKLHYPPVEKGAVRVKHYNPDYVPTIRKQMFWVIEAKSPKDLPYPFETQYLVQGFQYCIHPEIQAKYLLISNGEHSAIYDAYGSVFLGREMYEPILELKFTELTQRWAEIFELLAVEKLRDRIAADLKLMFDKLSRSSLDKTYPARLLAQIGSSVGENAKSIARHVNRLYVEGMDSATAGWESQMEGFSPARVFQLMDLPMHPGRTESSIYVSKSLAAGVPETQIFLAATQDFEQQSIFRKEQSFVVACILYQRTTDTGLKEACQMFFEQHKEGELPLINQVECALLRFIRKKAILSLYPEMRKQIVKELETAPEMVREVKPPTAFERIYPFELEMHHRMFEQIRQLPADTLRQTLAGLLSSEEAIDTQFWDAREKLSNSEKQIGGFESYGAGGRHWSFKNMLHNFGIEHRSDLQTDVVLSADHPLSSINYTPGALT